MTAKRVALFGEIVFVKGFNCSYPISVHLHFEAPKNWRKEHLEDNHSISTHCSNVNHPSGVAHFSHPFFLQYIVPDSSGCDTEEVELEPNQRPFLLFSVVGTNGKLLRDEGFAVASVPCHPGNYVLNLQTWKPAARNISDRLKDLFLGIGPSLQDPRALLSPTYSQDFHRMNLFGFETESSGMLQVRLRIVHQSIGGITGENDRDQLLLLERMSSSDRILQSVQAVIEAFQRARKKAVVTTTAPI